MKEIIMYNLEKKEIIKFTKFIHLENHSCERKGGKILNLPNLSIWEKKVAFRRILSD